MIGQIRSYISYITIDSENSYINRIKNMIDALTDPSQKETLNLELINKLNEIEILKKYQTKKEEIVLPKKVYKQEKRDLEVKEKSFEDEIADKIREYQMYQDDTESGRRTSISIVLPPIYTSAYSLVKIYASTPVLLRELATANMSRKIKVKKSRSNIPSLPIYDD